MIDNKSNLFSRLARTRNLLSEGFQNLVIRTGQIDASLWEEIEDQLIMADLGVKVSQEIVDRFRKNKKLEQGISGDDLRRELREDIARILNSISTSEPLIPRKETAVLLVVGVNGVGKTTTVAKLAHWLKSRNRSVMLAACDTYRAAAIEQLEVWGDRLNVPVISQEHGTDPAAVAHDAFASARSKNIDVLIVDSAGRQHVNTGLMDQLGKIQRVLKRLDDTAPHEIFLVVDAGNGQNVLSQTRAFNDVVALTGICVTKLDGTARGGIIVALAKEFGLPVPFIGTGEALEDLERFDPFEFAEAFLPIF